MASKSKTERLTVAKTYKLYIDGKFPRTESGRYSAFVDKSGETIANVCRASKKDARNAAVAARKAFSSWSATTAYLRGQIIYRIAEMLEGRHGQFSDELQKEGMTAAAAKKEIALAVDRLIYYAGWADKYTQIQSSVNPVASAHFNFSVPEPTGVVAVAAPSHAGLLGLVSVIAPVIVGGNVAIIIPADKHPLSAISFAEVLHASDVPGGVVNLLTGNLDELLPTLAGHMDINAVLLAAGDETLRREAAVLSAENLKRVVDLSATDFAKQEAAGPYHIGAFQEIKTTWHPVSN